MTAQEQVEKLCVGVLEIAYHSPTLEEIKSGSYYQYNPKLSHDFIASCLAKLTKEEKLILCMRPNAGYRTMIEWIGLSLSEQAQAILKVKGLL